MEKEKLIRDLISGGYLKTPAIIEAFQKIDRQDFVPPELKLQAYSNEPLPIGHLQTISQPLTVAFMLELLEPKSGEKILDIGAGSGWQSALLAEIVGETGKIFAIERILKLKSMAENNLKRYGFIEKGIVKILWDDGSKGYAKEAPYDKIIAAASAETIPESWKNQLKVGGRLVAPVKNSIVVLDKISETQFEEKEYFGFSFVPLVVD
ncbi:MAG: protein-L-isoaspartate(D-aspartate) O-methyltransferase [Candidatus Liptonbacteria bacterium]|nr:protein-L-isoaspartate(D-aspartate) O-methyltransferase [Candidatus Liptonbacteria bacterium]